MRVQRTAVVVPAWKVVSEQERRKRVLKKADSEGGAGKVQRVYLTRNWRLSLADWLTLKT